MDHLLDPLASQHLRRVLLESLLREILQQAASRERWFHQDTCRVRAAALRAEIVVEVAAKGRLRTTVRCPVSFGDPRAGVSDRMEVLLGLNRCLHELHLALVCGHRDVVHVLNCCLRLALDVL